jgi:hypothetical protein
MHPTQVVLLLNVEGDMSPEVVKPLLPHERDERRIITYSETGGPAVKRRGPDASPVDWAGVADGVAQMVSIANAERLKARSEVEYFVAGWAPLPVFVHLGFELGPWAGRQTVLNRRKDETWDAISSTGAPAAVSFFEHRGLPLKDPSEATGRVAVFVTTIGMPAAPRDAIRQFLQRHGEDLAGVVEMRTEGSKLLDAPHGPGAAQELAELFSEIPGSYPYANGIAIFVAGPATLAYLTGRAINPRVNRDVVVSNYDPSSGYELAFRLPWQSVGTSPVSADAHSVAERQRIVSVAVAAITDLRNSLDADDLAGLIPAQERAGFLDRLNSIELIDDVQGEAFSLTVQKGQLTFGAGLLAALRTVDGPTQQGIACLLFLHESYHFDQNLQSTNYRGIGRAGYALEEVDFWADMFAIRALTRWELRTARRSQPPKEVLSRWVGLTIRGIETFDRSEQGPRLSRLAERRLRRYLTWHMQYVRAETVRTIDDVDELLGERLIVELAPLVGYLDSRFDKYVDRPTDETELFLVIGGILCRHAAQAGFRPGELVDAARQYDGRTIRQHMDFVMAEHSELLAPWSSPRILPRPNRS